MRMLLATLLLLFLLVPVADADLTTFNQFTIYDSNDLDDIEIADMDLDGDPDVLCVLRLSGLVGWIEYQGEFPGELHYIDYIITDPCAIAVADLDNDGDTDVVSADSLGNRVTWYENRHPDLPGEFPLSEDQYGVRDVICADLDDDGFQDILAATPILGLVTVFLNQGDGTYSAQILLNNLDSPDRLHAADLDLDGDSDLIVASASSGELGWFENTGELVFTEHSLGPGYDQLETIEHGDMNGDGAIDILIGSRDEDNGLRILYNNWDGTFIPYQVAVQRNDVRSIAVLDIENDGDLDLFCTGRNSTYSRSLLVNIGDFQFYLDATSSYWGLDCATGDFNLDGLPDIVAERGTGNVEVWLNQQIEGFSRHPITLDHNDSYVQAVNCNNDRFPDLLALRSDGLPFDTNELVLLENEGSGEFDDDVIFESSYLGKYVCVDRDMDDDLDVFNFHDDQLYWFTNEGGQFTREFVASLDVYAPPLSAWDFDGNGFADAISGEEDVHVYWDEGDGTFSDSLLISDLYYDILQIKVHDMNLDGDPDIIVCGNSLIIFEYLGNREWETHTIREDGDGSAFTTLSVFDWNQDGAADLLSGSTERLPSLYLNQLNWSFEEITLDNERVHPYQLKAGDMDLDGDLDVFATFSISIGWYENIGGLVMAYHELDLRYSTSDQNAEFRDFDLDGDLDMITRDGIEITFWENLAISGDPPPPPPPTLPLTIELTPDNEPVTIPAEGGDFTFDLALSNELTQARRVNVWTEARTPSLEVVPLQSARPLLLPNTTLSVLNVTQHVPGAAQEGLFWFFAKAGEYPVVSSVDSFAVVKDGVTRGHDTWTASPWVWTSPDEATVSAAQSSQPLDYSLSQPYPNPFNAFTRLELTLPSTAPVRVTVFDVLGQTVSTPYNQALPAGRHTLSFDAHDWASGVYFVEVSVPGEFRQLRKLVLLQ